MEDKNCSLRAGAADATSENLGGAERRGEGEREEEMKDGGKGIEEEGKTGRGRIGWEERKKEGKKN